MDEKKLTPAQAFDIIYQATAALPLNRADSRLLDYAFRVLAQLLPNEEQGAWKTETPK
ncbi:hypothetical protein [Pedobacter jeongneungensis]|uniref:hypothetical protein n=1 Tax=Pedobacter jeongneungensis TaxID=947309 RepID=UPI000AD3B061|nr:hypothetical protein [Pedobacter jeongneungensis]